ncbi:TPA: HEPN domain-containing protein [Candidatus Bathyarchaeota archaeon]|nr:HEPN domain-containing protein [Candidatus Bathyarchaeota archaeon]
MEPHCAEHPEGGNQAMKRDVGRFIEVSVKEAERKLEDSERDFEDGSYGSAISHAYYAMYHVARACLARAGVFPRTHKGTVARSEGASWRRLGSREHGKALATALRDRLIADYKYIYSKEGRGRRWKTPKDSLKGEEASELHLVWFAEG